MKKLFLTLVTLLTFASCQNGMVTTDESTQESTELVVINSTKDSVLMYITLSGYNPPENSKYVQDVNGILGCTGSGLQGTVWIKANDTVSYTSTKYFSGNVSFGTPPLNCPDNIWKTGVNIFEFNLNNPQESIDLSCMAGVNCLMRVDLVGGPNWPADTSMNTRVIENREMNHNTGIVGVYPYGCTNCVDTTGKQPCQTPNETPNTHRICNPTRAKDQHGGKVQITFKGYTK